MKRIQQIRLIFIAAAFAAGFTTLLAATPAGQNPIAFHAQFLGSAIATILFFGAAVLLLAGLGGFTAKFKLGYILLCSGFIMLGIGLLQFPLLMLITDNIINLKWVSSGGAILPLVAGNLLILFGTRTYARLFGVRGWRTSGTLAMGLAVLSGFLVTILPHPVWVGQTEQTFDSTAAGVAFSGTIFSMTGLMALQASRQASSLYARPLRLLAYGILITIFGPIMSLGAGFLLTSGLEKVSSGFSPIPNIIAALVWLQSAVAFNAIRFEDSAGPQTPKTAGASTDTGLAIIDVVVYLARLASSPRVLDPTLDKVRVITSRLGPNDLVPVKDQAILMEVYHELESYLATEEPVRRYPIEKSRQMVQRAVPAFAKSALWQSQVENHP